MGGGGGSLAGVAGDPTVEASEGAGWSTDCRGEDAAHRAGHGQTGADVAQDLTVNTASVGFPGAGVDGVAVLGSQHLPHLHRAQQVVDVVGLPLSGRLHAHQEILNRKTLIKFCPESWLCLTEYREG